MSRLTDAAQRCQPETHSYAERDVLMDAVLDALVASAGVSSAQVGVTSKGTESRGGPSGEGEHGDAGWWLIEYRRVHGHFDRCEVVRRAGWFLASLYVRPVRGYDGAQYGIATETRLQLDARILTKSGWSVREVSVWARVTEREVERVRIQARRDPTTGLVIPAPADGAQAAQAACLMAEAGGKSPDIAVLLDRPERTVRHWIRTGRAKAAA